MPSLWPSGTDEVDHLMLNARLRDELEPFRDESLELVDTDSMTTPRENEFLASLLAWERAPVLPISKWFEPELRPPHPDTLDDGELNEALWEVVHKLYEKRVVLEYTDHLSDRELYCMICRDILPSSEKKLDLPGNFVRWHCLDIERSPRTWLRYYADDDERAMWAWNTGGTLPPVQRPPHQRKLPAQRS